MSIRSNRFFSAPLAAFLLLFPQAANAACSNPSGAAGDQIYSTTYNVMQFCNGSVWVNMGSPNGFGTLTAGDICTTNGTLVNCNSPTISLMTQASGTLQAAQFPALTGDVTTTAGSFATTVGKINGATLGSTTVTAGNLLIGSGSQWVSQTVTGDVTISSGGVTAIGANKVTMGDIAQIAGLSVIGNAGSSTANVGAITGAANQTLFVNSGGTGLAFGTLPVAAGGTGATTFTANLPLIGNGTSALTQGTVSGNTAKFATVGSGTLTSGDCVKIDANGNMVDAGSYCATPSGYAPVGSNMQIQYNNLGTLGGASNFIWNSAAGFAGIGTTTASAQFHMAGGTVSGGAAAWTANGIGIRQDAATYKDNSSSGTVASNYVDVIGQPTLSASSATTYTNAATMVIAGAPAAGTNVTITNPAALVVGSGNVGIGTTGPTAMLDVRGNIYFGAAAEQRLTSDGPNASMRITTSAGGGLILLPNNGAAKASFTSGTTCESGSQFCLANGNVGIGTTGPGYKLEVNGSTGLDGSLTTNRNPIYLAGSGDGNHEIGNGLETYNSSTDGETFNFWQFFDLYAKAKGSSALFINGTTGNVGIGTTTTSGALTVNGTATATAFVGQGAKVLLNTLTASNSATLQDTTSLTSAYRYYDIIIENLVSTGNPLQLNMTVDIGGSFVSTGYSERGYYGDAGANAGFALNNTASWVLNEYSGGNATITSNALAGFTGTIRLYNPTQTVQYKTGDWLLSNFYANGTSQSTGAIFMANTGAITGIKFAFSSGNIVSGTVKIYGWN